MPENLRERAEEGLRLWTLAAMLGNIIALDAEGYVVLRLTPSLAEKMAGACETGARALRPLPKDPEEEER